MVTKLYLASCMIMFQSHLSHNKLLAIICKAQLDSSWTGMLKGSYYSNNIFKHWYEGMHSLPLTWPNTRAFVLVLLSSKHARQMNAVVYKLWFISFHYLWRPFPSSSECSRIPMYQLSMIIDTISLIVCMVSLALSNSLIQSFNSL